MLMVKAGAIGRTNGEGLKVSGTEWHVEIYVLEGIFPGIGAYSKVSLEVTGIQTRRKEAT